MYAVTESTVHHVTDVSFHHYDDHNWTGHWTLNDSSWLLGSDVEVTSSTVSEGQWMTLLVLLVVSVVSNAVLLLVLYTHIRYSTSAIPRYQPCPPTCHHDESRDRDALLPTGLAAILSGICFADLLLVACSLPLHLVTSPPAVACLFSHYVILLTSYVSIYCLVIVSVLSAVSAIAGWMTSSLLSGKNALVALIITWSAFTLSNVKVIAYKDLHAPLLLLPLSCLPKDDPDLDLPAGNLRMLWLVYLTCAHLLPLTAISIFSAVVICISRRRRARVDETSVLDEGSQRSRDDRKHVTVCLSLTVVRALTWLPVICLSLHTDTKPAADVKDHVTLWQAVGTCVAYISTCSVPLITSIFCKPSLTSLRMCLSGHMTCNRAEIGWSDGELQSRAQGSNSDWSARDDISLLPHV